MSSVAALDKKSSPHGYYSVNRGELGAETQFSRFPNDDSTPIIVIDASVPFNTLPGILAHELAHIVVGIEENHSELWDNVRQAILDKTAQLYKQTAMKLNC